MYYPLKYSIKQNAEQVSVKSKPINLLNDKGIVGVVRGSDAQKMVKESIELIGGIERLGVKGREVLVKPNVNSDDAYPATTNPEVVKSVANLLYDAGAKKVKVGDMSGIPWLPTRKCMQKTGIEKAAKDAGAEVIYFEDEEWMEVSPGDARYLRSFMISRAVYEAEKLISLPVIKTHSYATYSMSLKNLVGVIHPKNRSQLHSSQMMEEMIAEISLGVYPDLVIMDGTKSMIAGGPAEGKVRETNLILSSWDEVAADIIGLGIVKSFGEWERISRVGVWEQRQIKRAVELNLGATSGREIDLRWKSLYGKDELDNLMQRVNSYI